MPMYEFECSCGKEAEYYLSIKDYKKEMKCKCGKVMKKIISKPANSYVSGYPYNDPSLGMTITDPAHRKKVMKQHSLFEKG